MTEKTQVNRRRRMAREPNNEPEKLVVNKPSRLDQLEQLLVRESGASIAEMVEATGWQQHSVRGALAGALKKRGLAIASEKTDGIRRYRAERSQ